MPLASGDTSPLLSFPFFLSPFFLPFSSRHFFSFFLSPHFFPSLSLLPLAHHSTHTSGTAPSPLLPHLSPFFFSLSTQTHYTTPPIAPVTVDQWATPPPTANDHLPIPSSHFSSHRFFIFILFCFIFTTYSIQQPSFISKKCVSLFMYFFLL